MVSLKVFVYLLYRKVDSMLLCVCSVIDHSSINQSINQSINPLFKHVTPLGAQSAC